MAYRQKERKKYVEIRVYEDLNNLTLRPLRLSIINKCSHKQLLSYILSQILDDCCLIINIKNKIDYENKTKKSVRP